MRTKRLLFLSIILTSAWSIWWLIRESDAGVPAGRERVVFWHFWGGAERQVVRDVVRRFNDSQTRYWVQEVPIPGQNLDMKFYMAFAGGDFPDCLNQDQQVIGQWSDRGILTPFRELVSPAEYAELLQWLNPAARKIGTSHGELYALCNGIDVRALYYRTDALQGLPPPRTIEELDAIAKRSSHDPGRIQFLPDDRRLWAWGAAFGGKFFDEETGRVTANDPQIVKALEWMTSYTEYHGLSALRAFRSTNRETGAGSMLLEGRYGLMMDGQWRVREFDEAPAFRPPNDPGGQDPKYGVIPLPIPPGGKERAGWVNGNFFVVPRGCKNPQGAWAFMKFWSGFGGHEAEAARTAADGGWIPASRRVVDEPAFQNFLAAHPNFRLFVDLADSPHQWPTPSIPVQAYFFERVNRATEEAMALAKSPQQALDDATQDVQRRLDEAR